MKLHILYKLGVAGLLLLSLIGHELHAQVHYNLSFENPKLTANPLQVSVDIMISFDQEGQLGSSNLAIEFDPNVLKNPQLVSQNLSNAPTYLKPSLTMQKADRVGLSIELMADGSGDKVGLLGNERKLARVSFDLRSTDDLIKLKWFESGTRGTVVFSDDPNFTLLTPAKLKDITVNPADFAAQDLILKANQIGIDARLEWEDVSVVSAPGFEVERSIDGDLFEVIGNVQKDASQGAEAYTYFDKGVVQVLEGTIYYRIKQKELDGSFIMSNTVELTLDDANVLNLQAFPNPVINEVKIQWIDLGGKAEISLVNSKGQLVRNEKIDEGQSSLDWDLSKISSGLYFVEYKNLDTQNMRASVTVQVK